MVNIQEWGEKRICLVNTNKAWGGGEKWHYDVATHLYEQGSDVTVISGVDTPLTRKLKAFGMRVHELAVSNWSVVNPLMIMQARKFLRSLKPDIMLLNQPKDVKTIGVQARLLHVPRIIYRRGSAIPIRNTFFNRILLKRVLTDILVNSEETKRTINQTTSRIFAENRIKIIYNGLKFAVMQSMPAKKIYSRRIGEVVIGNMSRLSEEKAQYMLVDIAARLKNRGKAFKVIIGGEGEKRPYLEHLIHEKKLEGYVLMPGFISNIRGFMESIDIFVHPSLWEGFGYVMAEAMYFRRPVVAFNTSGIPEVVNDGETGLLAKFKDLEDLYQKVLYLIENPEVRAQMGDNGYSHVARYFDFEKNVRRLTHYLYRE